MFIINTDYWAIMLIAMQEQDQIHHAMVTLSKKYSNECTRSFPNFLLDAAGKIAVEKDGSLPKRLTFLGHNDRKNKDKYCKYSCEEFVAHFINQMEAAIKINPKIKDSITCIDLLGCNIGFVAGNGSPCFAKQVATLLAKAGYDIKVRAVTNLGVANSKGWHHMVLSNNRNEHLFRALGFSSEADRLQFNEFRKQKRLAKTKDYKLKLKAKIAGCTQTIMAATDDIRASLDQNPNCNFSHTSVNATNTVLQNSNQQTTNIHTLFSSGSPTAKPSPTTITDCKANI